MQIGLAAADVLGNLQIFAPVLVALQPADPGNDRVGRLLARDVSERLDIHNVGDDIAVQPGANGDEIFHQMISRRNQHGIAMGT
ncbi:hypothetical protein D3C80_1853850 [compost metagenome]